MLSLQALVSFQMMYEMRIIVISEGLPESSPFLQELIQADIQNVATAEEVAIIKDEIRECFTEEGMVRYRLANKAITHEVVPQVFLEEGETQYHFDCTNVTIAVAGCDRRMGVTTTAFNLVSWINAHGGSACYIESNTSNHLAHIIQLFKPEKYGNYYTMENSDFYFSNELNHEYNIIVLDCGVLNEKNIQTDFSNSNIRLLCGSAMPYELAGFYRAIERCKSFSVQPLGLFVPANIRSYLSQSISQDIIFCNASHDLFDSKVNGHVFSRLLSAQIQSCKYTHC